MCIQDKQKRYHTDDIQRVQCVQMKVAQTAQQLSTEVQVAAEGSPRCEVEDAGLCEESHLPAT